MKSEDAVKRQIEKLAFEADQAMGLLDRGDYRDLIANLLASIRMLLAENEALTRDRDDMTRRLKRSPLSDPVPVPLFPVAREAHQTPAPQPQAVHGKPAAKSWVGRVDDDGDTCAVGRGCAPDWKFPPQGAVPPAHAEEIKGPTTQEVMVQAW